MKEQRRHTNSRILLKLDVNKHDINFSCTNKPKNKFDYYTMPLIDYCM